MGRTGLAFLLADGRVADVEIPGSGDSGTTSASGTAAGKATLAEVVQRALNAIVDDTTLPEILVRAGTNAYEAALAHEVASAGGSASDVELTNRAVLVAIEEAAQKSATGIAETFERDLLRFIAGLPDETDPEDLPELVAEWNRERAVWKSAQIAITETARSAGIAQRRFIDKSGATGKAWFGNSTQCVICRDVAADNPYQLDDSTVGSIFHPGELDWWRIEYDTAPSVWTGG